MITEEKKQENYETDYEKAFLCQIKKSIINKIHDFPWTGKLEK